MKLMSVFCSVFVIALALHPQGYAWGAKAAKHSTHAEKSSAPIEPKNRISSEEEDVTPEVTDEANATTVSGTDISTENMALVDRIGGRPFPWYGSLKKTEVNVRSGPGSKYPILWIYTRPGFPVQVLTRYDNYYKIRDVEGEEGWTYVGMVSKRVTGLVAGRTPVNLTHKEDTSSRIVARIAPGVIVEMESCDDKATPVMCRIVANGYKGWLPKKNLEMVE